MRSAPIFLASKLTSSPTSNTKIEEDQDDDEMRTPHESRLLKPTEVSVLRVQIVKTSELTVCVVGGDRRRPCSVSIIQGKCLGSTARGLP